MIELTPAAEMFPNFLAEETRKRMNKIYNNKPIILGNVSLMKNPTPSLGRKRRARRARGMRSAAKALRHDEMMAYPFAPWSQPRTIPGIGIMIDETGPPRINES